ncbi:MAG: ABC transporter permease [Ilumatobacteraceae bacterium]
MPERGLQRRIADVGFSPVTASLGLAFVLVAAIILATGENPLGAYAEMWKGATSGSGLRTVVNRAIPIVGMAIAISIPFRAGIINLGAEGQMVVGGLAAALTAIYVPGPGMLVIALAFLAGAVAGALWALIPALAQTALKLPILISSLLLNAPARALTSYLVKYSFADKTATSATTVEIPATTKIPTLDWASGSSATVFLLAVLVVAVSLFNNRTSPGYERYMSGLNLRFARYGGVDVARQTVSTMLAGGAIAGMVGAHLVLGQAFRFVDNDLAGTGFAWTGLLVTLLAAHRAIPALIAGFFFAALQVGGLAMQRSAGVSWQLAQVLQAVVILALAMRVVIVRRRDPTSPTTPLASAAGQARGSRPTPATATTTATTSPTAIAGAASATGVRGSA